jgi:hypothetical protein
MNKILLNVIFLLISVYAFTQTKEINGFVYSSFDDKNVVVGIPIIHNKFSETPPAITFHNGEFNLVIPSKTKSPTQITIDNTGNFSNYKIVNENTTNNISTTNQDPVKVYVGNKDVINKQRMEFYKINDSIINKKYEEQISQLQISNTNYKQIIDSLNIERAKDKAIIIRLSEQVQELQFELYLLKNSPNALYDNLIAINTQKYNDALNYFMKGDYKNAVKDTITEEELSRFEKLSEIVFNRVKLNALIFTAMGKYKTAIYWYDKIRGFPLAEDKEDIERFFIYRDKAELEFRLKQYEKAISDITIALDKNVNDIYKIEAHNLLGNILQANNEKNYHNQYEKAVELYKEKKKEVNISIPKADKSAAISHTLLADYYKEKNKTQKAENNYKAALNIYIEMWKNKEYDNVNYLNLLVKMATFYTEERKTNLVKQCNDRIGILMSSIDDFSKKDRAKTNEWLGYLDLKNKKYDEALKKYLSAFSLYAEMNKQTPLIYKDGLIRTAFMAAVTCNYNENYQKSIQYCNITLSNIGNNHTITEYQKMQGYVLALLSNNYKKIKNNTQADMCMTKANNIAKKVNDPSLMKYVQYIKLEKMHNTIDFFMDWVLPYIGMLPYIWFGTTLVI